jgi:TRAP-type C4-dicarboxylate transport system permease small subunit
MSIEPSAAGAHLSTASPPQPPSSAWLKLTGAIAISGGLLALAVASLATVSVLGRWLYSSPVEGDFEFVKMATAIAVFTYLPFTQARRANVVVDSFTGWLPQRGRDLLDALWDLVYAGMMGFCAWCLFYGTFDSVRSGETTMQLQIPLWPSIALSLVLCAFLALTAVATAWALLRRNGDRP